VFHLFFLPKKPFQILLLKQTRRLTMDAIRSRSSANLQTWQAQYNEFESTARIRRYAARALCIATSPCWCPLCCCESYCLPTVEWCCQQNEKEFNKTINYETWSKGCCNTTDCGDNATLPSNKYAIYCIYPRRLDGSPFCDLLFRCDPCGKKHGRDLQIGDDNQYFFLLPPERQKMEEAEKALNLAPPSSASFKDQRGAHKPPISFQTTLAKINDLIEERTTILEDREYHMQKRRENKPASSFTYYPSNSGLENQV
jgi:hypothetical protein